MSALCCAYHGFSTFSSLLGCDATQVKYLHDGKQREPQTVSGSATAMEIPNAVYLNRLGSHVLHEADPAHAVERVAGLTTLSSTSEHLVPVCSDIKRHVDKS